MGTDILLNNCKAGRCIWNLIPVWEELQVLLTIKLRTFGDLIYGGEVNVLSHNLFWQVNIMKIKWCTKWVLYVKRSMFY